MTYQRIELWLGKAPARAGAGRSVRAIRQARQASALRDRQDRGADAVTEMVLLDQLRNQGDRVRYLSRKERSVPETWLNPMFLARNPAWNEP